MTPPRKGGGARQATAYTNWVILKSRKQISLVQFPFCIRLLFTETTSYEHLWIHTDNAKLSAASGEAGALYM